ncbi:hypothetical protein T492DRAFT_904571, partial [Pavlovales sp. CCMP2436]
MTANSEAVALFKAGDFAAAADAFSGVISSLHGTPDEAVALVNRATCYSKLGKAAASEADCRRAVGLAPLYAKAYTRLAAALPAEHDDSAPAAAAAVALSLPKPPSDELRALYDAAAAAASTRSLGLPELSRLAIASTSAECTAALMRGAKLVVLRPGAYEYHQPMASFALVGLGSVELRSRSSSHSSHAVYASRGITAQLVNVALVGLLHNAAACVDDGTLRLIGCSVRDYEGAGVLAAGPSAQAYLVSCAFERCAKMAVEVREGASVEAYDCLVQGCKQGFNAYGGARSLVLKGCTILRCTNEGVFASGSVQNAHRTREERQGEYVPPPFLTVPNAVSLAAEAWGRERCCALSLSVTDCNISSNCSLGLSCDNGCQAEVRTSSFEWNDPYSVLVKGNSDVSIAACRFVFAGKSSTSWWAQKGGGSALKLAGVHVAINYGGDVQVVGCAFAGAEELAVEEEMTSWAHKKDFMLWYKKTGAWSKPALKLNNKFDCELREMPSLSQLAASLPRIGAQRARAAGVVPAGAQCRITRTFQQAGAADELRILLAACGDLRNLVTTAAACARPGRQLRFVCNDGNASMLARDAVLLHLAVNATPEAVLAVAPLGLGRARRLQGVLAELASASCVPLSTEGHLSVEDLRLVGPSSSGTTSEAQRGRVPSAPVDGGVPWPDWLRATAGLSGSGSEAAAEAPLREACRAWATCTMTLAEMLRARDNLLNKQGISSSVSSSQAVQSLVRYSLELSMAAVGGGSSSKQLKKEIGEYVRVGSLMPPPHSAPNITLLLSPSLQYCSYFSSSIVRALPLGDPPSAPLAKRLLATLAPQLTTLAAQLRAGSTSVSLVLGDIITVATECSPCPSEGFDYVDCSNVADSVSSITQYKLARIAGKQQTFAQDAAGLSPALLAALLRLRFVGARELHTGEGLRMEWAAADASAQAGRLSAGSLLLELSPLFTRMVADQLCPRQVVNYCEWRLMGGPLALAHLLKLGTPEHARALIDALLRTAGGRHGALFSWELTMHAPRSEL